MNKLKFKDVFGQLIWDFYTNNATLEFIERDDNYIDVGEGKNTYFALFDEWKEIEKKGIQYAKGKVLDIGCGAGRHSLYLQQNGYKVFGIDNSPLAIKVSKKRGVLRTKELDIEKVDLLNEQFDTLLMLGNNFGLFGTPKRMLKVLKKFDKITSPNATIIAETHDPYKTKSKSYLAYQEKNRMNGRMSGQSRIRIRYNNLVGSWFEYLSVSVDEMKFLLTGTNWQIKKIIHSKTSGYISIIQKKM